MMYSWGWAKYQQKKADRIVSNIIDFVAIVAIIIAAGVIFHCRGHLNQEIGSVMDYFWDVSGVADLVK